eukprot:5969902-Alexandrium_andersonii.AAC.1
MSASLVGSEMCIRDSPDPPALARGTTPDTPTRCFLGGGPGGGAGGFGDCLLYTSDAADDM